MCDRRGNGPAPYLDDGPPPARERSNDLSHRSHPRQGDYIGRDPSGPEEITALLRDLESRRLKILKHCEVGNPLADLYT